MTRRVLLATVVAAASLPGTGLVNNIALAAAGGATPSSGTSPSGGAGIVANPAAARHNAQRNQKVGPARIVNGRAVAPSNAPTVIKEVIAAANRIAFKPYIYGGGHGSWNDSGYDCSGSVSYALHGANIVSTPMDSTEYMSWGRSGSGRYISIWANSGHVYMYVLGLRFDTGAQGETGGSRWSPQPRDNSGFVERHPAGL